MNKVEIALDDQATVESTEQQKFELSLAELDFIGGGQSAVAIA